jgi:hypothetical protein
MEKFHSIENYDLRTLTALLGQWRESMGTQIKVKSTSLAMADVSPRNERGVAVRSHILYAALVTYIEHPMLPKEQTMTDQELWTEYAEEEREV